MNCISVDDVKGTKEELSINQSWKKTFKFTNLSIVDDSPALDCTQISMS